MFCEGITPVHLIIVLVVALLILGPGKLPETLELRWARRSGKFRHGLGDAIATTPGGAASPTETTTLPATTSTPPPPAQVP